MGRSKAIQALEIYREHEKFRKHLESMQEEPSKSPFDGMAAQPAPDKGEGEVVDDGFLSVLQPVAVPTEEEKKDVTPTIKKVSKRASSSRVRADSKDDQDDKATAPKGKPAGGYGVA